MKHTTLYNEDGTPKDGVNIQKLRELSNALHNPNVLSDFLFDMVERGNCVIGFAVAAGIFPEKLLKTYVEIPDEGILPDFYTTHWIFSMKWERVDNTREGAALRIDYLLDTGLPENYRAQIDGKAPLIYRR